MRLNAIDRCGNLLEVWFLLRFHERWQRAIESIRNGANQFRFGFVNHTVGSDGFRAGIEQILFDLWRRQIQPLKSGIDLRQVALVLRNKWDRGLRGVAQ